MSELSVAVTPQVGATIYGLIYQFPHANTESDISVIFSLSSKTRVTKITATTSSTSLISFENNNSVVLAGQMGSVRRLIQSQNGLITFVFLMAAPVPLSAWSSIKLPLGATGAGISGSANFTLAVNFANGNEIEKSVVAQITDTNVCSMFDHSGWLRQENTYGGNAIPTLSTSSTQGYASAVQASCGETINLYVSSPSPQFRVFAYRVGFYGSIGSRLIWSSASYSAILQKQQSQIRKVI